MTAPAWLSPDAPENDVVLSSRVRIMRNLQGHRFVHRASEEELLEVMHKVLAAADAVTPRLETFKSLTNRERDDLVGCRLISPEFEWTLPGRALMVDALRAVAILVNEEDHIRAQALTAGLSFMYADQIARESIAGLSKGLRFAHSHRRGFLSASHINLGEGKRISAMFHLIGLAQVRRLHGVIAALTQRGISVRGLFGESSRAVGAFAQVSIVSGDLDGFSGACEYLIREERLARRDVGIAKLTDRANQAREFALGATSISLADALRVLGWIRWAATTEVPGFHLRTRETDAHLAELEIRGAVAEEEADRRRAASLRASVCG